MASISNHFKPGSDKQEDHAERILRTDFASKDLTGSFRVVCFLLCSINL